jgi:ATP-dependent RNA helicase RhlE
VPDFDYAARPKGRLEVPLAQRIAEIRERKRQERARQQASAARRSAAQRGRPAEPSALPGRGRRRGAYRPPRRRP